MTDPRAPTLVPPPTMRRTHLPIAEPCHEDWDAMDRVERGRFCHSCDKKVFDLSSMTEREAEGVLRAHAGERICVRYCHDGADEIRFRPERPAKAAVLALALAACTPHGPEAQTVGELRPTPAPADHDEDDGELMGKIEAVPPEPEPTPAPAPAPPHAPAVEVMGDVAAPPVLHEVKGDVVAPATGPDAPCDSKPTATAPREGRRPPPGMQKL